MRRTLALGILLAFPFVTQAAIISTNTAIEIGVTPRYPQPGETVTFTAVNTAADADTALYTWTVDGELVARGIGQKRFISTAGKAGTAQTVSVTTSDSFGDTTGTGSVVLNPGTVDLVWEGKTATPPLYQGRPLPNAQSPITLLAVPHISVDGTEVAADELVYTWDVGGALLAAQSGYGKNSIIITPPRFGGAFSVSVHAETADGRGAAEASVSIAPQQPRIMVYEHAPLLGILLNRSVGGGYALQGDEVSFSAFPLFVANTANLTSKWTLDGDAFSVDTGNPFEVTFRKVGEGSGAHTVTFSFENPLKFTESAQATFTLNL